MTDSSTVSCNSSLYFWASKKGKQERTNEKNVKYCEFDLSAKLI